VQNKNVFAHSKSDGSSPDLCSLYFRHFRRQTYSSYSLRNSEADQNPGALLNPQEHGYTDVDPPTIYQYRFRSIPLFIPSQTLHGLLISNRCPARIRHGTSCSPKLSGTSASACWSPTGQLQPAGVTVWQSFERACVGSCVNVKV
jgi:hypothetical protein